MWHEERLNNTFCLAWRKPHSSKWHIPLTPYYLSCLFQASKLQYGKKGIQRDRNCPYPKSFGTIHLGTSALPSELCLCVMENVYYGGDSSTDRKHFISLTRNTNMPICSSGGRNCSLSCHTCVPPREILGLQQVSILASLHLNNEAVINFFETEGAETAAPEKC